MGCFGHKKDAEDSGGGTNTLCDLYITFPLTLHTIKLYAEHGSRHAIDMFNASVHYSIKHVERASCCWRRAVQMRYDIVIILIISGCGTENTAADDLME